jgi:23S rRNA (pseudouridine1915-N3)-methyltransferase
MKLALLYVSGQREAYADSAEETYLAKIRAMLPFECVAVKAQAGARAQSHEKRRAESEKVLAALKSDDFVIAFAENGKLAKDSREFSRWLVRAIESGKKRVVFVIGGAYGLDDTVTGRAEQTWSLSPLTMNHLVARIMAMEQIYRGLAIWRNLPYHND